jgi:copper chaperone CopZ
MQTEKVVVQNVKCQVCVRTVRNALSALPGVEDVQVEIPTGEVIVRGQNLAREPLADKLAELGYPER